MSASCRFLRILSFLVWKARQLRLTKSARLRKRQRHKRTTSLIGRLVEIEKGSDWCSMIETIQALQT